MAILDKFTVVDLVKTRSASVITVTGNVLRVNKQTAEELGYPPYIQILANVKDKQFAIRVCKEGDVNAVPFSKPEEEQKGPVKINIATVSDMIRKMGGWGMDESWNIPGIYFAEDRALVYDIKTAVKPGEPKGGWIARKQKEAEAAAAEEVAEADAEEI